MMFHPWSNRTENLFRAIYNAKKRNSSSHLTSYVFYQIQEVNERPQTWRKCADPYENIISQESHNYLWMVIARYSSKTSLLTKIVAHGCQAGKKSRHLEIMRHRNTPWCSILFSYDSGELLYTVCPSSLTYIHLMVGPRISKRPKNWHSSSGWIFELVHKTLLGTWAISQNLGSISSLGDMLLQKDIEHTSSSLVVGCRKNKHSPKVKQTHPRHLPHHSPGTLSLPTTLVWLMTWTMLKISWSDIYFITSQDVTASSPASNFSMTLASAQFGKSPKRGAHPNTFERAATISSVHFNIYRVETIEITIYCFPLPTIRFSSFERWQLRTISWRRLPKLLHLTSLEL